MIPSKQLVAVSTPAGAASSGVPNSSQHVPRRGLPQQGQCCFSARSGAVLARSGTLSYLSRT